MSNIIEIFKSNTEKIKNRAALIHGVSATELYCKAYDSSTDSSTIEQIKQCIKQAKKDLK